MSRDIVIAEVRYSRARLDEEVDARRADFLDVPTVAVTARPTMSTVIDMLAVMSAGSVLIPVSPDAGPREREHILADSGARLLVDEGTPLELATPAVPARDAALVLYTSGTTGLPKGVPLRRSAIDACLSGLADAWDWTADDTVVHGLPLHHVHGFVLGILGPLAVGSGLHHTGRPTPEAYASAGGTLYFGVPTIWSRIAADVDCARRLAAARLLVSGSAALPAPVHDRLEQACGAAPIERYGMTETLITLSARADMPRVRGSVGRPLSGVTARIVTEDEGSESAFGALEVSGPTIFEGYLTTSAEEDFTADGWFRTGDIATVDDEGLFRIVGRASTDLIKSGGYRIGAGEVEDALLAHPRVSEAAVIGRPDDDLGERIVAFVVAESVTPQELVDFVSSTLSHHKRPREVILVDALPRNVMGKVDKIGLRG